MSDEHTIRSQNPSDHLQLDNRRDATVWKATTDHDLSTMSLHDKATQTKVLPVLTRGRKILWNAELSGISAFLLAPVRDFLLDPLFGLGTILLPPLAQAFPRADTLLTLLARGNVWLLALVYRVPSSSDRDIDMLRNARNDLLVTHKAGRRRIAFARPPSDLVSAVRGAIAFTLSVVADLVSVVMDRSKMAQWWEALAEFQSFLDASGVGTELEEAVSKPLWAGRLLDNVKILNDIQEVLYVDRASKIATIPDTREALLEGKRMMRFATAAYGTEMIRSALDRDADAEELDTQMEAIAFHCNVQPEDIRILDVDDGGDMRVLRHFVAIDRETCSVVLALRGTLSISGALVDMKGMDHDFCGCKAHKGMAEMAENIWTHSGDKILKLFEEDEEIHDFSFVIVGHSLGAGAACLLNVKCHAEQLFGDRTVKCYGFAPPPTLCTADLPKDSKEVALVQKAVDNCVCYIHDNDCIPLLSVVCIRRLATLLDTVDNRTEHLWAFKRWKLFWEFEKIPQEIFDDVKAVEERKRENERGKGASRLIISTKLVVWMKKNFAGTFDAFGCNPNDIADLNIFCNQDMVSDHLCEPYEDAFDILAV